MTRPLAIDLCCKAGGATKGLQNAGFFVIGVDIKPQPRYCGDLFVQGDVLRPPVDLSRADFIWASPPCQAHTEANNGDARGLHECIIAELREILDASGRPWVMENVRNAPLRVDLVLTGAMFAGLKVIRRRHFEMNFPAPFLLGPPTRNLVGAHGWASCTDGSNSSHIQASRLRYGAPARDSLEYRRECMGIDWPMTRAEVGNAIPPAYSEFIAREWMAQQ